MPRLGVYFIFTVDIAAIVKAGDPWPALMKIRTDHESRLAAASGLVGAGGNSRTYSSDMRSWMEEAIRKKGKAIWNDSFLMEDAPYVLEPAPFWLNGRQVASGSVLSTEGDKSLSCCLLRSTTFHLYRELVPVYTVEYLIEQPDRESRGMSVDSIITTLNRLESISWLDAKRQMETWLSVDRISEISKVLGDDVIVDVAGLTGDEFKRKARVHKLLVLGDLYRAGGGGVELTTPSRVAAAAVLDRPEIAGMLNTADWYELYRPEYLENLKKKNIGYRSDEVFLTDRKASLIANENFWNTNNSLNEYRLDILLSIEFYMSRLVQCHSLLQYLQKNEVIRDVTNIDPAVALDGVVAAGKSAASLSESLDPARLVDHGFTRLFMLRLRSELGIENILDFIGERIDDATKSVQLRSAVTAESHTASRALKIAQASMWLSGAVLALTVVFGLFGVLGS